MNNEIMYYDFWVGLATEPKEFWKLDSLKMPSPTPVCAMFLRSVMYEYEGKRVKTFTMSKDSLLFQIHKVVEYQKIKRDGQPLKYKRIREYEVSETFFKLYK